MGMLITFIQPDVCVDQAEILVDYCYQLCERKYTYFRQKKPSVLSRRVLWGIYVLVGTAGLLCTPMPIRFSDYEIYHFHQDWLCSRSELRSQNLLLVTIHVHRSADIFLKLMFGE
jgi:hypothetical protein